MNKFLLACAMLFSLPCLAQYETRDAGAVAPYFKAGVNFANVVNWDDNEPTDMYTGLSGGMGLYIRLGKQTKKTGALSIEGLFSGQGFKMENSGTTTTARVTYFNIPVIYRQYFGHMYLAAGAQYGIFVGMKEIVDGEEVPVNEDVYKYNTWSGLAGIGVNFGGKRSREVDFGLEATYAYGLSKLRSDFPQARHSVINISMFLPVAFVADIAAAMQQ